MQLLNSKAFYLKNYSLKPRSRTQERQSIKQQKIQLDDVLRIRNIKNNTTMTQFMPPIHQNRQPLAPRQNNNKQANKRQTIYQRQQDLILKIYKFKLNQTKSKKWHSVSLNQDILVQKHPIAEINSLQFQSMKPTDRYFQKIQNIRLAQQLLLARPSRDINRNSQQKFYKQQQTYKLNISKLSSREEQGKKRQLHRKKWID